tara:strand:+ start:11499 stop:11858 length:360 start_codon:yes stop_codon:yes gene_type:complete
MNYEIVKLGKKDLPIYFGFNALRKYCRATGTSLHQLGQLGQSMSLDDIVELIFHGTQEGHRRAKVAFDFTSDDIADLLDGDQTGMQRAMELFAEHMGMTFGTDEKTKKGKKQNPVKSKK